MADYIPLDIQEEIIKKLPVKSLIRFQSVSKSWKSLIHNSKFIANYHVHQTQPRHHLLVNYIDVKDSKLKHVSIVDDNDSFPEHKVSLTVPTSWLDIDYLPLMCKSQGVFCLYNENGILGPKKVVIWNPSIRKSVDIDVPNVLDESHYETIIGLGVCPVTSDIKLVKVNYIDETDDDIETIDLPWQVEVFSLSSRRWRSPSCTTSMPRKAIIFHPEQVNVDGYIYWLAFDRNYVDGKYFWYDRMLAFDLTNENFTEIYLPDSITAKPEMYVHIYELKESLVLLDTNDEVSDLWMMENGFTKSFKKLFSIKSQYMWNVGVLGFRKSVEPILVVVDEDLHDEGHLRLVAYEPHSKHINEMGIYGRKHSIVACSYTETLLLLDQ